jgi:alpha-L-fucosidase 2
MQGPFTQSYMPMGDLEIVFDHGPFVSSYHRDLDLETAVASTRYTAGNAAYYRESFASFPDQAVVTHLAVQEPGKITFTAKLSSPLRFRVETDGQDLVLIGKAPLHADPQYHMGKDPIRYADDEKGEGMNFVVRLRAVKKGGEVSATADGLRVQGADEVTLLLTAATSFNGFAESPGLAGRDPAPLAKAAMEAAAARPYPELKARHVSDYQSLFNRVSLDLGPAPAGAEILPTHKRVEEFGGADPDLVELLFQFGRYLLISSSRPGGQPANLQG